MVSAEPTRRVTRRVTRLVTRQVTSHSVTSHSVTASSVTSHSVTASSVTPLPDMPRRIMLSAAGSGALLLAGCRGIAALGPPPKLAADVRTLEDAIAAEELMVARYQAAVPMLSGNARVAATISGLLAEHQAHLVQLRSRLVLPPRLATASPRPSPTPPALPSEHRKLLGSLAVAEQSAAVRLARQLLDVPPALAQLMASIGASEAAHAAVLNETRLGR